MGLFDKFKKDIFKPKPCLSKKHEFVTVVIHTAQCVSAMSQTYYRCQKCGARYYGDAPQKYGMVVEKEKDDISNSSDGKYICEKCGRETIFANASFCSACGHKRS